MIQDNQALLADAQAFSSTGYTTNTYDTAVASADVGVGEPLALVWTVDTAADAGTGDETYQFQVVQSANANLSSHDVLSQTDTSFITRATLVAGYQLVQPIPAGKSKRYLGGRAVLGGTTPSITVTCSIMPLSMVQNFKAYPDGLTIS